MHLKLVGGLALPMGLFSQKTVTLSTHIYTANQNLRVRRGGGDGGEIDNFYFLLY